MLPAQTIDNFQKHLLPLAGSKDLLFLDVDAGDGERGEWLLDNILVGLHDRYVGLGSWESHPEQEDQARRRLGRFGENTVLLRRIRTNKINEIIFATHEHYHLIEAGIDCLHLGNTGNTWPSYGLDPMTTFRMMTAGGLVIFSDYRQKGRRKDPTMQIAADAFAQDAGDEIEIVVRNSQAIYRKIQPIKEER